MGIGVVQLLIILVLIGVALYFVNTITTMDAKIKTIINVVVVLLVVLWLLEVFGLLPTGNLRFPR